MGYGKGCAAASAACSSETLRWASAGGLEAELMLTEATAVALPDAACAAPVVTGPTEQPPTPGVALLLAWGRGAVGAADDAFVR
jgi:hypothetical protein